MNSMIHHLHHPVNNCVNDNMSHSIPHYDTNSINVPFIHIASYFSVVYEQKEKKKEDN